MLPWLPEWQAEEKGGVADLGGLSCALNSEFSAITMGQRPGDEEAQAGVGLLLPASYLWSPATVEDVGKIMGGYSRAVVPDPDEEMGGVF